MTKQPINRDKQVSDILSRFGVITPYYQEAEELIISPNTNINKLADEDSIAAFIQKSGIIDASNIGDGIIWPNNTLGSNISDIGSVLVVSSIETYSHEKDIYRMAQLEWTTPKALGVGQILVDYRDTTLRFLSDKLLPGDNISFEINNVGQNETLTINANIPPTSNLTVETYPIPSTLIFPTSVIEIGTGLTLTNDGGKALLEASGGAAGSLTVKDINPNSVTIPNVNTIEVDRSTGILELINDGGRAELTAFRSGSVIIIVGVTLTFNNVTINYTNNTIITYDPTTINIFNGIIEICGYQFWCCAEVPSWTADQDDWPLPQAKTVYLIANDNIGVIRKLTGIIPATISGVNGPQVIAFVNNGVGDIALLNQAGPSAANHQIILPDSSASLILTPNDAAILWYDTCDANAWRVLAHTAVFAGSSSGVGSGTGMVPNPGSAHLDCHFRYLGEDAQWWSPFDKIGGLTTTRLRVIDVTFDSNACTINLTTLTDTYTCGLLTG